MATTITPQEVPPPTHVADADVLLDIEDIMARYRIGRTKAYAQLDVPGFPRSVVPNLVRIPLVALRTFELRSSLGDIPVDAVTAPTPLAPPPARRAGRPAKEVA